MGINLKMEVQVNRSQNKSKLATLVCFPLFWTHFGQVLLQRCPHSVSNRALGLECRKIKHVLEHILGSRCSLNFLHIRHGAVELCLDSCLFFALLCGALGCKAVPLTVMFCQYGSICCF